MTTDPNSLLRQLQPAVLPSYVQAPGGPASPRSIEHQPFDVLLSQARQGLIDSGRAVAPGTTDLTPDQLRRLSAAADAAEAAGARTALLLLDGRGLVVDVPSRTISDELAGDASRVASVDAAVSVPGQAAHDRPLPPPGGIASPAVTRALTTTRAPAA